MSTITVPAGEWADIEVRDRTLREARKEARASRTKVLIKVVYPKRYTVLVATVDGRFYQP